MIFEGLDLAAILYLVVEMVVVAVAILALFELRHRFGLGLLYVFAGSNQYLQTVLASTFYVDLGRGISVSPGSAVLFSATLFAVLLTYLRESIPATRTLIYGIVLSNVTLTALAWWTERGLASLETRNVLGVPPELFSIDLRLFVVGTVTLIVDSFLIVIVYESLLQKARRLPRLVRLVGTLLVVLYLDAFVFTLGSFYGSPLYGEILSSQLWGKSLSAVVFGGVLWVYLAVSPRPEDEGETGHAGSGVLSILTYRDRYEVVKRQLEVEKAANLAKSRFLAHMSHELRTPLNAVIGFTGVLSKNKRGNLGAKDLLYLERIGINARHLLDLINRILDLSKIEAGKLELEVADEDVGRLVTDTADQLRGEAEKRGLDLRVEVPAGELRARIDPSRFRQILINLVGNALKFTEEGSVTVRLLSDASGRAPAAIEVTDTGPGIERDELERIFQAFEQSGTEETRRRGTGLGLAITRALCERMACRLEVESEPGRGSTFRVVMEGS